MTGEAYASGGFGPDLAGKVRTSPDVDQAVTLAARVFHTGLTA